jgi:hypothetical protein
MDNSRRMTNVADNILERVVRGILRMRSREELPPSPLEGKPQLMYVPEDEIGSQEDYDR